MKSVKMINGEGEAVYVRKGDTVCFKSDIEQTGEVVCIIHSAFGGFDIRVKSYDSAGFVGAYIGGQQTALIHSSQCWID